MMKKILGICALWLFFAGWGNAAGEVAPLWDLSKDAGKVSADFRKDGFVPLDREHAFAIPHTAVKDSTAFTVEMKFKCEKPEERTMLAFLRQKTPTTGWGVNIILHAGGGSPIFLAVDNATFNAGRFRSRPGEEHTLVITARKGLVVVYWNGKVLKRFYTLITPNLEPVEVCPAFTNRFFAPMKGVKLTSLKFWGPELEYYLPGESRDFAEGFRGGAGWLVSCPTEDPKVPLPRILCYGDSILGGYGDRLRKRLAGKAYVYCWRGFQSNPVGDKLDSAPFKGACGVAKFDHIVFNNGLHSLHWTEDKVSDAQIKATQRALYRAFRDGAPQAKIWWLATTPHTARKNKTTGKVDQLGEKNPMVCRINRLTAQVMDEEKIPTVDAYGALAGHLDLAAGDCYHWYGKAYEKMVDVIVKSLFAQ